ncbi:ABC transporter permease [Microterricola viridarii]|uniref:ABC transporter permease n=1 Tax=Microterricola viridarii TaxID=412690 RepID=A0A109QW99_9MICO|nr:ABC transporter permease [Microterricola viridarii]AMB57605.1 ABC transporter permease [Microterricola viridarii]
MARFITQRLLFGMLTILVVSVVAFLLVRLMPGSPGTIVLGIGASEDEIAAYNASIGWNDPLALQYLAWLGEAVRGNFGVSLIDGRDINADITARLPVTFSIALLGTAVSAILGVALGVIAAVRGGLVEKAVNAFSALGAAIPGFWIGIVFVFLFSVQTGWLPATGFVPLEDDPALWAQSLVLPVATLALGGAAFIARQTRASMLDALTQDHVRTLRATAMPEWRIRYVHALRYASLPIVAGIGLQFIALFGGSVIIEQIFAMPGLGQSIQGAAASNDGPLVLGIVVTTTIVVVIVNLLLELSNRFLDPKLRTS